MKATPFALLTVVTGLSVAAAVWSFLEPRRHIFVLNHDVGTVQLKVPGEREKVCTPGVRRTAQRPISRFNRAGQRHRAH